MLGLKKEERNRVSLKRAMEMLLNVRCFTEKGKGQLLPTTASNA